MRVAKPTLVTLDDLKLKDSIMSIKNQFEAKAVESSLPHEVDINNLRTSFNKYYEIEDDMESCCSLVYFTNILMNKYDYLYNTELNYLISSANKNIIDNIEDCLYHDIENEADIPLLKLVKQLLNVRKDLRKKLINSLCTYSSNEYSAFFILYLAEDESDIAEANSIFAESIREYYSDMPVRLNQFSDVTKDRILKESFQKILESLPALYVERNTDVDYRYPANFITPKSQEA